MRIYISGPISGMKDLNVEEFNSAEQELRVLGHKPINPHDIARNLHLSRGLDMRCANVSWSDYMRPCISALSRCHAILMLEGWRNSRGARLEIHIARELGIKIFYGIEDVTVLLTP